MPVPTRPKAKRAKEAKVAPIVESLRAQFGFAPAPDLAALLARLPPASELGPWTPDYQAFDAKSWERAVAGEFFSSWTEVVPALTGTVPIGRDGGGDRYFAEVHPARLTVFFLEAGVGHLHYLADSVATFAALNDIVRAVFAHCDKKGIDPDDIGQSEIRASTALRRCAASALELEGKIDLRECRSYAEPIAALSKKRFASKSKSPVLKLAERSSWIKRLIAQRGDRAKAKAKRPAPMPKALASLPAARVQALVEACVFAPAELSALTEAAKSEPAEIVRASAKALARLGGWKRR